MKSLAAILVEQNKPLEFWELDIPPLEMGQVLVEMEYSGICRTQLNEVEGLKGPDKFLPHTMGHEGSGKVIDIGEGITKVKPGDNVVLSWIKGKGLEKGNCKYSYKGQTVNSGGISTFLKYSIISENRIIPLPVGMPMKEAAILGCALPTGAGVVFNDMDIKPTNSLIIFGAGGVGLSALIAAKYKKAEKIVVVDISDEKLKKAKEMGATHTIKFSDELPQEVNEITNNEGFDFAFECSGNQFAMEAAYASLKKPKGLCVIAGNIKKDLCININPFELIEGKRIIGTWGGSSKIDEDVVSYSKLLLSKDISLNGLITHEIGLTDLNDFFKELKTGVVGRGIIKL